MTDVNYSNEDFLYIVPKKISREAEGKIKFYFRSADIKENSTVNIRSGGKTIFTRKYNVLRPPEMEAVEIKLSGEGEITFELI